MSIDWENLDVDRCMKELENLMSLPPVMTSTYQDSLEHLAGQGQSTPGGNDAVPMDEGEILDSWIDQILYFNNAPTHIEGGASRYESDSEASKHPDSSQSSSSSRAESVVTVPSNKPLSGDGPHNKKRKLEDLKVAIQRLWIQENRTIKSVMGILEDDFNVVTSERTLKRRLADWNIRKYQCRSRRSESS